MHGEKSKTNQKPFLKWVGGKTQILPRILEKIPKEMTNYHEPFLGGGSVLFGVLTLQHQNKIKIHKKVYAYDINKKLINLYKNIQNNKDELYTQTKSYVDEYDSITGTDVNRKPTTLEEGKTSKESYYYWIRQKFNNGKDCSTVECSALFLFLNKTCFRGMYREGPNGYNVPYGHYKKTPTIINKPEIDAIHELIKDVIFVQSDFLSSFKNIKEGDFVYLDPPYAPETNTSFVKYTADGFDVEQHKILFSEIKKFDEKNIKFVMSNAKVRTVDT
jgi:DNA adenine methylase